MTQHYHDPADRGFARDLRASAPEEFAAYRTFSDTAVGRADGAIPLKYRELIAVAVALTTQCVYCLETHTAKARKAGVTQEELAEAVYVTAALRAGGAAAHGLMAMRMFNEAGEQANA
ncbi:carboxymuconolactone decarboxylase family protein [Streptomyces antimycoticus]|uniref:carboxymuconolactone decarboxylase family protein n=1 Tax=Streptomyces antimycoticus TaxID=68175 RepID=UPI003683E6BF